MLTEMFTLSFIDGLTWETIFGIFLFLLLTVANVILVANLIMVIFLIFKSDIKWALYSYDILLKIILK